MFRCTTTPAEPSFPPTLYGLNMVLSTAGQPVDATTGAPYAFFHDCEERINNLRKEAFHAAMRGEMKLKLASDCNIWEHYITANNVLSAVKPAGKKHVPVLMSPVSTVQTSRDVLIIVGESSQDCGVFAWRLVREEEGLMRGTAVGLAAAIKELCADKREESEESLFVDDDPEAPAVIIVNPGQLFYSYEEGCTKTLVSWNDGKRGGRMEENPKEIDMENQLEGHRTAEEHVGTFIEKILPTMIDQRTRIYFIAIGDGAQNVLAALDKRMSNETAISSQITALALICPQITSPESSFGDKLLNQLATQAKSWVCSDEPLGECIATSKSVAGGVFGPHRPDQPILAGRRVKDDGPVNWTELTKQTNANDNNEQNEDEELAPPPLTPTFSAGKPLSDGVTETAFEICMPEVRKYLYTRRGEVVEKKTLARKMEELTFTKRNDAILAADDLENGRPEEESDGEYAGFKNKEYDGDHSSDDEDESIIKCYE